MEARETGVRHLLLLDGDRPRETNHIRQTGTPEIDNAGGHRPPLATTIVILSKDQGKHYVFSVLELLCTQRLRPAYDSRGQAPLSPHSAGGRSDNKIRSVVADRVCVCCVCSVVLALADFPTEPDLSPPLSPVPKTRSICRSTLPARGS